MTRDLFTDLQSIVTIAREAQIQSKEMLRIAAAKFGIAGDDFEAAFELWQGSLPEKTPAQLREEIRQDRREAIMPGSLSNLAVIS